MKSSPILIGYFILCLLCSCVTNPASSSRLASASSTYDTPPQSKNGECYAKCLIGDKVEKRSQMIAVYTGNENAENVAVQVKEVVITPASSTWVKKIRDGCVSNNPVDCEVACLVESPAVTKEYKVLLDTTQSKNFEMQEVVQDVLTEKGGITVWTQILCSNRRTPKLIGELQLSLSSQKYYTGPITRIMDIETQDALMKFQRANNLPIGHINYESMKMLGLKVL